MKEKDYWKLLNKNTLICHSVIVLVLIFAYIGEILKHNRTVGFVIAFSIICVTPLVCEYIIFKRKADDRNLKKWFVIGYAIFYTFNLYTAGSVMNWVYILPMASVLLCYCDLGLIIVLFGYALVLNVITLLMQKFEVLAMLEMYTSAERLTSWEIQIACLLLTGIFLYFSTKLIKDRTNVISELMDDVYVDALTKCKNVRYYEECKVEKFKYSNCNRLCLGFIDIDDFKHFNTDFGHTFGDKVLMEIGQILLTNVANINNTFAIRIGGDEFLIISKSLTTDAFKSLCANICANVKDTLVEHDGNKASVSISIGVSTKDSDKHCKSLYDLYVVADERNQSAKEKGKNCVICE